MKLFVLASFFTLLLLPGCRSSRMASEQTSTFSLDKTNLSLKITDTILSMIDVDSKLLPKSLNYLPATFNVDHAPAKRILPTPFENINTHSPSLIVRKITVEGQLSDSLSTAAQKNTEQRSRKEPRPFFPQPGILLTLVITFIIILLISKFFRSSK